MREQRTIKFRALSLDPEGTPVLCKVITLNWDRDEIQIEYPDGNCEWYSSIADQKLMQWTGLKDKNGTGAYAKDIVESRPMPEAPLRRYILGWNEYEAGFSVYRAEDNGITLWSLHEVLANGEIVGNIWQNPELIQHPGALEGE